MSKKKGSRSKPIARARTKTYQSPKEPHEQPCAKIIYERYFICMRRLALVTYYIFIAGLALVVAPACFHPLAAYTGLCGSKYSIGISTAVVYSAWFLLVIHCIRIINQFSIQLERSKYKDIMAWILDLAVLAAGLFLVWFAFLTHPGYFASYVKQKNVCAALAWAMLGATPLICVIVCLYGFLLYRYRRPAMIRQMMIPPAISMLMHAELMGDYVIS